MDRPAHELPISWKIICGSREGIMIENKEALGAIILAGGNGERFQGKKQFYVINGKPLWRHVYDKIQTVLENNNIVVVGVDISGGKSRTESVIYGIRSLSSNTKRVIIAEAARPLVTRAQIREILSDNHPSCSFVMPLVNTVVKREGMFLNREELYELLVPQAFDFQLLKTALDSGKFKNMTDETRVMFEYHGIKPHFIETTENLIKVTYQRDLPIIESLMHTYNMEE